MSNVVIKTFSTILIFVMSLVTGVSIGKIYVDNLEVGTIISAVESDLRESSDTVESLVSQGLSSTPDKFSAVEVYLIAEYNLNNSENYCKIMTGTVYATAGVTQKMKSVHLKSGDVYVYDKLSPSFISLSPQICSRIIYDATDEDSVLVYSTGTILDKTTGVAPTKSSVNAENLYGVFSDNDLVEYTMDEYKEIFNTSPTNTLPYIISSITCQGATCSAVTANGDGTYSFSITFNDTTYLSLAALNYSYEIKYSSGMSDAPLWVSMSMDVVVDSNFNFVSISYSETYKMNVTIIGWTPVTDEFVDYFYFDESDIEEYFKEYEEVLGG